MRLLCGCAWPGVRYFFVGVAEKPETRALHHVMELALHTGCNDIVVNSGNLIVVEAMNNKGQYIGSAAAILYNCP
jgi:hypothetical protein